MDTPPARRSGRPISAVIAMAGLATACNTEPAPVESQPLAVDGVTAAADLRRPNPLSEDGKRIFRLGITCDSVEYLKTL